MFSLRLCRAAVPSGYAPSRQPGLHGESLQLRKLQIGKLERERRDSILNLCTLM